MHMTPFSLSGFESNIYSKVEKSIGQQINKKMSADLRQGS